MTIKENINNADEFNSLYDAVGWGAYDDLKEYYDDYLEFTNLVLDPSGNLNSYSSKFSDLDSKVSKDYSRIEYYFDN